MGIDVQSLFRDVADLPAVARELHFDRLLIPAEVRAEVESLCRFDAENISLTDCVAELAAEILHPDFAPAEGSACGSYKLVRMLGEGGMGTVFLAARADGEVDQCVAIKFIRNTFDQPSLRERFLRERQILASMNHPGIARLFDAGHTGAGQPYLVMEYIEGVPLDVFARNLDLRGKLELFLQVCAALAYAHRNLVVHRDLKPSNVLVNTAGQAKLLDFGIARILDAEGAGSMTVERVLTPDFASPEQVRGQAQTTATDVYSLGALLYQLLTGRSPHARPADRSIPIETTICSVDPPPPSHLNPALARDLDFILAKALRKEPEERYPSVDALADDICAFLEWRPVRARSGSAWYRTRKLLRRHWLPAAAFTAAMVCLSAGIFVANLQRVVAQHRFSQLRQLANTLLTLDADLYGLPGSTQVRQKVVAASMQYLEGLRRERGNDRDLNLDLARGYILLAHAQGVPAYPNLGQFGNAEDSLRKAEDLAESAGARTGNRTALLIAAEADQDRMMVADTEHRYADALTLAEKCAARVESLIADPAVSTDQRRRSSQFLANVALALMNLHRYDEAVHAARKQVELARSAAAPAAYLLGGMSVLANALRQSGDLRGALQTIAKARALAEATTFGNQTEKVSVLYALLYRQGIILGQHDSISLDRPADAMECFREAFELVDRQASQDPNDSTIRDRVATVGREWAEILVATDAQHALDLYDRSLARLREAKSGVPSQRGEALTLAESSYALRKLNRRQEAGARIDDAFALLRATGDYPASEVKLGGELEAALRARADHSAALGQTGRALETYRDLLSEVLASNPSPENDLHQANDLSRIYLAMARLELLTGQREQAQSLDARRARLWRLWDRKLPRNAYVQRQLAVSSKSVSR